MSSTGPCLVTWDEGRLDRDGGRDDVMDDDEVVVLLLPQDEPFVVRQTTGIPARADRVETPSPVALFTRAGLKEIDSLVETGGASPLPFIGLRPPQDLGGLGREGEFGHGLLARSGRAVPPPQPARISTVCRDHLLEALVSQQTQFGGRQDLGWLQMRVPSGSRCTRSCRPQPAFPGWRGCNLEV